MPFKPGDIVTVDFPGVTDIKRRPAVVLSSHKIPLQGFVRRFLLTTNNFTINVKYNNF